MEKKKISRDYFPKAKKRTHAVTIRFNDHELAIVKSHLESHDISIMADYCRNAVLKHVCNTQRMEQSVERRVQKRMLQHEQLSDAPEMLGDAPEMLRDASPHTPLYNNRNNLNSSSTSPAHAREDIISWLTDDEETMRVLCMREHLTVTGDTASDLKAALQPYIDEFINGLIANGDDLYLKTREDIKHHFSSWLRKYKQIKKTRAYDDRTDQDGEMDAERALQEYKASIDWDALPC